MGPAFLGTNVGSTELRSPFFLDTTGCVWRGGWVVPFLWAVLGRFQLQQLLYGKPGHRGDHTMGCWGQVPAAAAAVREAGPLGSSHGWLLVGGRFQLQQLLYGKLDGQLPPVGPGSHEEQRMEAEMAEYMDTFKMQARTPGNPKTLNP